MMFLFLLIVLCDLISLVLNQAGAPGELTPEQERAQMGEMLATLAEDIIKEQAIKSRLVDNARQDNQKSAAFEVGYMTQAIHEHYRKMLAKWESLRLATLQKMYNMEVVLYLEEVEHLYWTIKHEVHMLHEVERKYKIKTAIDESYEDPFFEEVSPSAPAPVDPNVKNIKEVKSFDIKKIFKKGLIVTTRPRNMGPFPIDYGFEMYEWNSDT